MARSKKYEGAPVILTMSVAPEVAKEFEERRGNKPRGEFLKWLLEVTRGIKQKA